MEQENNNATIGLNKETSIQRKPCTQCPSRVIRNSKKRKIRNEENSWFKIYMSKKPSNCIHRPSTRNRMHPSRRSNPYTRNMTNSCDIRSFNFIVFERINVRVIISQLDRVRRNVCAQNGLSLHVVSVHHRPLASYRFNSTVLYRIKIVLIFVGRRTKKRKNEKKFMSFIGYIS